MTETYSGRIQQGEELHFSSKRFQQLVEKAREEASKQHEHDVAEGTIELFFSAAHWTMYPQSVLDTIKSVLNKMFEVHKRSTGVFSVTLSLPKSSVEEKRTAERSEGTLNDIENKAHESFRRHCL